MLVVDFIFKDNRGQLNNCIVFKCEDKVSIQNKQMIKELVETDTNMFMIQNRYINGKTHINNIQCYKIHEIDDNLF
ncbi:hypothetical protein [uncultured Clostridium sp.]|uniref:hypothetical protein n=1 Tax=uncultured Clostridium sp. TaxID=59620 RepID=UPI003217A17E